MLQRYIEQQAAIFATLTVKDIRKNADTLVTLSEEDVRAVEDAVNVLRPLKTITTILCSEKVPTVSMILPLKELILKYMAVTESDSGLVKSVKSAIVKDLKTRYTEPDINKFLQEATALDPRFRSLPYHNEANRLLVFSALTMNAIKMAEANKDELAPVRVKEEPSHPTDEAIAQPPLPVLPQTDSQPPECNDTETGGTQTCTSDSVSDSETPGPSQPKKTKSAIEEIFGEVFITHVQEAKPLSASIEEEVQKYKLEECIPLTENPLLWWKMNAVRFPALAGLVKQYLGVCATSVPSERVFSSAGDIVTAQRASLSAENVDVLIFLKKNMKL
ncbi:E3 SUMO-protein ligase ZBED1-like [Haliotis rubra]|uniref:E3 SUMO-protein ligase ZBED1-like n=1 Tax=Haliotis rubra TaxID=36100 RepID=UPI001EE57932|nr:E3 SUMO-protein ligase ZBED1-like [Haliotis rubra]